MFTRVTVLKKRSDYTDKRLDFLIEKYIDDEIVPSIFVEIKKEVTLCYVIGVKPG